MAIPTAVLFSPTDQAVPTTLNAWLERQSLSVVTVKDENALMALALRGRPRLVVFDARRDIDSCDHACRRLKADSYTGIVPAVLWIASDEQLVRAFDSDADEVLRDGNSATEVDARLDVLLRRSDRDVRVHPSTRLPGTMEIEAEIGRRMARAEKFAVCYADLDHFKEFNDRYSYYDGDRVIRILAKILHDVVKGVAGEKGFVGHIGGDDFIFIIPVALVNDVCAEIVEVFDALAPYQYSEQDRRAGYYFGKDRRGQLHRVPLMTVSIGVVTNERRHFTHAAQVSELATEMKSYAKTLPGSVFTIDRRHDAPNDDSEGARRNVAGVAEDR
ncbi:MAG: diguanylate cyclase [Gemmatimonadaceae bacterium]|nr:diguanylate cyclase [Gemmatimonadaceae bacterium]